MKIDIPAWIVGRYLTSSCYNQSDAREDWIDFLDDVHYEYARRVSYNLVVGMIGSFL
jgi:hypothetical protein